MHDVEDSIKEDVRTEFGFLRTVCACKECTTNCIFIPGYLIPADLARVVPDGISANEWAVQNLLASPGALVTNTAGHVFRIPTLVPARTPDGSCKFLNSGKCDIHRDAPYGCAFFGHMSDAEANHRSIQGLTAILHDMQGKYSQLWQFLWDAGLRAPGPEESRFRMNQSGGY